MLLINVPTGNHAEKDYAITVLFEDFLGLSISLQRHDGAVYTVRCHGLTGTLTLPDTFFSLLKKARPDQDVRPDVAGLIAFDTRVMRIPPTMVEPTIPILFGEEPETFRQSAESCHLPIDIIGTGFFMLTRHEELICDCRDEHDRFPSSAAMAGKAGLLERPIVDEYVEILWSALSLLWPTIKRRSSKPLTFVTCDVDTPYLSYLRTSHESARVMAGDIGKRHSVARALKTLRQHVGVRRGDYKADPYHEAIYWIMDVNERFGNPVSYFFMTTGSNPQFDMGYSLDEPVMRKALASISERGHFVGLHPSYESHTSPHRIAFEYHLLRQAMDFTGIRQQEIGGRQHYLRWNCRTPSYWQAAGLDYDSTLSFPDHAGFRTGTSREYKMFDLSESRPLSLRQRPLIATESIIISDVYMGMGITPEAADYFVELKRRCHMFGGTFTLLWHNSSLLSIEERKLYEDVLAAR